jgi:hypothetical protein
VTRAMAWLWGRSSHGAGRNAFGRDAVRRRWSVSRGEAVEAKRHRRGTTKEAARRGQKKLGVRDYGA